MLYLYFLDFVFYEYSSFNSSQEFFLHFGIWKNHSKQLTLEPNLGDQNLVKFGTQHPDCLIIILDDQLGPLAALKSSNYRPADYHCNSSYLHFRLYVKLKSIWYGSKYCRNNLDDFKIVDRKNKLDLNPISNGGHLTLFWPPNFLDEYFPGLVWPWPQKQSCWWLWLEPKNIFRL